MKTADEDLERALRNWGRWKASGKVALRSSLDVDGPIGDRDGWSSPPPLIIDAEAEEMDAVIETLPGRYQEVIRVRYIWEWPIEVAIRRCRCCRMTYFNRLEKSWELIAAERARRREAAQVRRVQFKAQMTAMRSGKFAC